MVVRTSSVKLRTSNKSVDIKETSTQGQISKGVVYQQEAIKSKIQSLTELIDITLVPYIMLLPTMPQKAIYI